MDNLIPIIFICWIIFKAIKSAIDKAQRSSQQQTPPRQQVPPQQRGEAPFAQGQPHRHEPTPAPASLKRQEPFAQGRPHQHEPTRAPASQKRQEPFAQGRPHQHEPPQAPLPGEQPKSLGDALGDMERLFSEAMERKRGLEQAPNRGRPQVARPRPVQQRPEPEPEADPWIPPPTPEPEADPWIPSRPEPKRKVRVEQTQVARSRRREVAKPAAEHPKPPAPARTGKRRKQRRRIAQRKCAGTIPILGKLDLNDVRRGIVIAEILGPPKGLGNIDSHVI